MISFVSKVIGTIFAWIFVIIGTTKDGIIKNRQSITVLCLIYFVRWLKQKWPKIKNTWEGTKFIRNMVSQIFNEYFASNNSDNNSNDNICYM